MNSSSQKLLVAGYTDLVQQLTKKLGDPDQHFKDTPKRIVKGLEDMFCGVEQDPTFFLETTFTEKAYDQMIWVTDIPFVSYCRHHFLPFFGRIHFAYLPKKRVVGLSKIPRFIKVLCARPQLQENLTQEIADVFSKAVKPLGCGVIITGQHACMFARGTRTFANMRTVQLRGEFLKPHVKSEFFEGVK